MGPLRVTCASSSIMQVIKFDIRFYSPRIPDKSGCQNRTEKEKAREPTWNYICTDELADPLTEI